MYLGWIGEHVPLHVHDHCVLIPAVPERVADLHILVRPIVAFLMVCYPLIAEILKGSAVKGGDDVPGRPAISEVV